MSWRKEARVIIICDKCGVEFYHPPALTAMEGRIAAGMAGWSFRSQAAGYRSPETRKAVGRRGARDWCPGCTPTSESPARVT